MKRLLPFLLIPAALWGDAGEVEIRERNSSNRTTLNQIATGSGDRILVIDDSNAQGAKVEGATIGSGLSFDGTTLTATAAGRATTDLAGGTALAANVDYYDTFAADRTNLAVWGTPTDGQYSTITFDVTGATRSIGFNSTTVYRLGESSSSTGPWNFPVGNHKITLARMDGKWFLIDSAVDTEAANVFLASPDGTTGPMTPRAIVDGDIPASITRDSEAAAAYEPLDADIAKVNEVETITANWVNTANPWADNEVSDTLTASLFVGSGSSTTAVDLATAEVAGTLPVARGGTGVATSGTTSQIAVGGGTGSPIVWTTATGTGAPVRANSPTLVTPTLGVANATSLNTGFGANELYAMDQNVRTTDKPTFANVQITPSSHTYAASVAIDFSGDGFKTLTLTGDITFTTSNLAAGRSVTYRINPGASARTPTFPGTWIWIGATPTSFTASKIGVLTVTSWSTTDADVTASYNEQP